MAVLDFFQQRVEELERERRSIKRHQRFIDLILVVALGLLVLLVGYGCFIFIGNIISG